MRLSVPYSEQEDLVVVGGPRDTEKPYLASSTFEDVGSIVAEGIEISTLRTWGTENKPKSRREKRVDNCRS